MLTLQNISYAHPNKNLLFENLNLTVNQHHKIALIGNNGSGKSTLLKIIATELQPIGGRLFAHTEPYYVPQIFGQFNDITIAEALKIDRKLNALNEILSGKITTENYAILDDDWNIEERCQSALDHWQLPHLDFAQKMGTLSGGQKTKVFLAGISIHQPELILLDEPSNHLDAAARSVLYDFIKSTSKTLVVVSHDRQLLNLLDSVCELNKDGISVYGGNYNFYKMQKEAEKNALNQDLHSKEKALRKAREKEREANERQQKLDARGKGKQEKSGVSRIMMNTLRNNAENSTSKIKSVHAEKIAEISHELRRLRDSLPDMDKMKFGVGDSELHKGKLLFEGKNLNVAYGQKNVWLKDLDVQIYSGERIALLGKNGSGKTTLIKVLIEQLVPSAGMVYRATGRVVYVDQDYSYLDNDLTIYEQTQKANISELPEHEIRMRLNRSLFPPTDTDRPIHKLSGGERMRLVLCCLTLPNESPDIIIFDEPTNNLDIQNIEMLSAAINQFKGTLIVVSHDQRFLEEIKIERSIQL